MAKLTENAIEEYAIELLEQLGYQYGYGPALAPGEPTAERASWADVLLLERLRTAIARLNPTVPAEAREDALRQVRDIASPELLANNETFHRLLTEGVKVGRQQDGQERGEVVWLVDFQHPDRNEFLAVNQLTIVENGHTKRPDLVLFVNGLPLVVLELKNAADEKATLQTAYKQLETYKALIPGLFTYNGLLVISDGHEARAGSLSAGLSRYMAWKSADGLAEASPLVGQLETLIRGMLGPATLLDLLRHFVVFEKSKKEDPKTGVIAITTVKKVAAYHQYYAVNAAVASTLRAAGHTPETGELTERHAERSRSISRAAVNQSSDEAVEMLRQAQHDVQKAPDAQEDPVRYGLPTVKAQPFGDQKAGVVWHTQGSGKSLSMVFYTGKIVLALDNPTVLVITDRNDLDDQLFDTFAGSTQLLRQEPRQVEDRQELKTLLRVGSGGVVFTTIQKFQPEEGNVYEELSARRNIVVIADEAHRTQYGFKAKTVDVKNEAGDVVGKKVVYGFAKYLRDALPNATYLGFTGTPVEKTDVNTPAVFGNYIDIYDIAQAVEDGATVRIYYESRLAKVSLSEEGKKLVADLDKSLDQEGLSDPQKAKAKWTQLESLIGSEQRIGRIAADIVAHFEQRQEVFEGKGMIVAMSRRIAAELYAAIVALRPDWHTDDLTTGRLKVVMTSASSDGPDIAKHHTHKAQRRALAERMKDPADPLQLVIVRDMWLTGFDAPSMHTLYIDKPMQGHNLMQAIARVNRVYKDKPGGLVVDYLGIASDLKKALAFYSDAGGKGDPAETQIQAVALMAEKLEVVQAMYHGFAYDHYYDAGTAQKLSMILAAEDHVLGLPDGKKRYIYEVTALSQAFAIAIPHELAMAVKEEIGFFQAVKARLAKFTTGSSGRSDEDIETTIRQVIDKALVSEQVIDVFDAAGIKKPDISILSEEFLLELKGMQHKNIALEVLQKLLRDEIKARAKYNLVKSKSLMEMLESAIKRYHAKIITAAEVIDYLIKLGREEVAGMDSEAAAMGLTDYEYAFYSAVANNDSAQELMQKDKLRELAVVLTERVRSNASIDWTIKESVRAKLKVIVKRTLRQFGYPPDMELLATETVLKQAELIANELTKK
ncbi:type I restriction endonuclease subunit R [Hymenobacter segetis]|uniref:Type I restriction enzyme endonuclease subunit n=1 Tax=Hymenobacter segetis TaxID=2025509 RepID=A0ABU9LYD6_9BACT